MTSNASTGESRSHDSHAAGAEAAQRAVDSLDGQPTLAAVFATAGHDQSALLEGIRSVTGETPLVGCTAEGVIGANGSCEQTHAVGVLLVSSTSLQATPVSAEGFGSDARSCAERLAEGVPAGTRLLWLFPDGLTGNTSELVSALRELLPEVMLFGGSAGELMKFDVTYQYCNGRVLGDSVVGMALAGVDFEVAVSHGCSLLGIEHTVTRAEGATVHELDGRPAWEVMREYLDDPEQDFATAVPYLCLAEPLPAAQAGDATDEFGDFVIRVPLGLDAETGSLFFPGSLPVGQPLQMARRDVDDVTRRALACASELAGRQAGRRPSLILQSDCTGRGRMLFGGALNEQLIGPLQASVGDGVPWLGFHSYGEIAPVAGRNYFHNYTMALCALYL